MTLGPGDRITWLARQGDLWGEPTFSLANGFKRVLAGPSRITQSMHTLIFQSILDLQSIPRESNNKDVAAMLVELTIEANEESFVIIHQHGGNDVNCNPRIERGNSS